MDAEQRIADNNPSSVFAEMIFTETMRYVKGEVPSLSDFEASMIAVKAGAAFCRTIDEMLKHPEQFTR